MEKKGGAITRHGSAWKWIAAYLAAAAVLAAAGTLFALYLRSDVRRRAQEEISAVADLKAEQIGNWVEERLADAGTAAESPFFSREAARYLAAPDDLELKVNLLSWMQSRMENYGYVSSFLLDAEGNAALSLNPRGDPVGEYARGLALECMAKGAPSISDLHRGEGNEEIHIDLVVPVAATPNAAPAGALLLRIDHHDFLYPFIQSWPTPSETAETLLVRREGDEVVFLNELRHRSGTALQLRLPLGEEDLPAARAALGEEGAMEGVDYRGVEVLAATRSVPGTGWRLVAKVDASEVYSPTTLRVSLAVALTLIVVLALGFAFALAWTRRQAELYRRQCRLESERAALARHYEYLTRYANDIIILMDTDWRIAEVNQRAVQAYGYSREELIGMPAANLRSPAERPRFAQTVRDLDLSNGTIIETEHMRKDGTVFPVEISARIIEVDGDRFYQGIIRDISERRRMEAELRASEEKYRLLFRHAPIGVFQYDLNLVITDCNDRFVEILRSSRERLVGLDMNRLRDRSVLPAIRAALEGIEGLYEGPYAATTSEAHVFVSLRTTPLRDAGGAIIGGVGIVEDITERKRIREELAERELFLRRLTDNMLDLISQIDVDGNFVYLSPSNQRVLGYREGELLGSNVMELVHPEDLPAVAETYARSNRELAPGKVEFRAKKADGTYIWVESVGNPLFDEEGKLIGAIFVTRDIGERKRAERRLERLTHCFLGLGSDPLENIIRIVDTGKEILEAGGAHYTRLAQGRFQIYHTARDSAGFEPLDEEHHLVCREMIAANREQPVSVEDLGALDYVGFLPEVAKERFASYFAYPVRAHGRTVGVLGLLRREKGEAGGEERDLAGTLARAIAVEEERLAHEEELRDFVDIASHELRHPMTVIKGYASTLLSHHHRMDEETRREVLMDIERGVDRLERLVYQLLDTARIDRDKLALNLVESDLVATLEEVVRETRKRDPLVPIAFRVHKRPKTVRADPERIAQVLVILLENAVNYSPGLTGVEVEVAGKDEGGMTVSVLDRGLGVPEEERQRIFERFYQVGDATHHSAEGIGLGLYIAREIVKGHGGHIWHEPREGGGSIFRFTLP